MSLDPVVETSAGKLRGVVADGVHTFRGIPYAEAPVGNLRFRPPRARTPWAGVRDAKDYAASCPQRERGRPDRAPPIWIDGPGIGTDEDCLALNVWTGGLGAARRRPVLVWLHTGGFASGSGSAPLFEGANLVKRGDVVVVSLNHRLGALGFLDLGSLDPAWNGAGNVGIADIVLALRWVRDNIAAFGGDPQRVMLLGESGGGLKISTLLAMPEATQLFQRAALQSGARHRHLDRELSREATERFVTLLGARDDLHALQSRPVEDLVAAQTQVVRDMPSQGPGFPHMFTPVLDGFSITSHPFDPAAPACSAHIPLLIGYNRTEATYFARMGFGANDPSIGWDEVHKRLEPTAGAATADIVRAFRAQWPEQSPFDTYISAFTEFPTGAFCRGLAGLRAGQNAAPTFMYRFDWKGTYWGSSTGSPHMIELPFVFDTVDRAAAMVGAEPETFALAARVSASWCAFAENGDPSTDAIPAWPRYDTQQRLRMHLDHRSSIGPDLPEGPRTAIAQALGIRQE